MKKQKNILELAQSIPYEGIGTIYNDGSIAYLSQGSMTRQEFDGETTRVAEINLSSAYWQESFEVWGLDINDFDENSSDYKELLEEIIETIESLIDMQNA